MTLRTRFTLLATALVLALLAAVRVAVRAAERERVERESARLVAGVLAERFPGPPGRRAPGEPPTPTPVGALPSGVQAVLLYAPPAGNAWMHVLHTGEAPALAAPASLPVPAMPERGPEERVERREGRTWRVRTELVARPKPPLGPEERPPLPAPPPARPPEARPPDARPPETRLPRAAPTAQLLGVAYVDVTPLEAALGARLRSLDLLLLAALAGGAGLAWLASGLMLRPLRRAAAAAEAVERVDQRLPARTRPDELGRLLTVLNGMLGRLEAGARRERTFLATASHELRRPLAALTGELELALRSPGDAGALAESARLALGDARAMGRLVGDLLDHARLEAGALPLALEPVRAAVVVGEALERTRRAQQQAPPVAVEPLPEVDLAADRGALVRLLENLLENAVTHGGPDVRVVVRARVQGPALALEVEDDGPGIPPATLARLFEPFQRGDQARSRPGSGLGLSIARGLAQAHGGSLSAFSPVPGAAPGRPGTRFVLLVPLYAGS